MLTSQNKTLLRVTAWAGQRGGSREDSGAVTAHGGMWAVHSPRRGLSQHWPLPSPGPHGEVWGTRARSTSMRHQGSRILTQCCCLLLPHSCPTCACLIPGRRSSPAPSAHAEHCSPAKSFYDALCITSAVKGACYLMSYLHLPFLPANVTLRLDELLVQPSFSSTHQFPFCRTTASSSYLALTIPPKFCALHLPLI